MFIEGYGNCFICILMKIISFAVRSSAVTYQQSWKDGASSPIDYARHLKVNAGKYYWSQHSPLNLNTFTFKQCVSFDTMKCDRAGCSCHVHVEGALQCGSSNLSNMYAGTIATWLKYYIKEISFSIELTLSKCIKITLINSKWAISGLSWLSYVSFVPFPWQQTHKENVKTSP